MKNWSIKESQLTDHRNKLCTQGYSRDESIVMYQGEQAANSRRYNGLMKNRRLTSASFK
jgi:hypothetical protein